MDALIQNKCEYELLGIVKEIAKQFDVEIFIETAPLENGGLRRWFRIATREENRKATITTGVITVLLTILLTTPITKTYDKVFEKLYEDKEEKALDTDLKKEQLKNLQLQNSKLQREEDREEQAKFLNENTVIKKKKSIYYESLKSYPKVEKVSYIINNQNKTTEIFISRNSFEEFILLSDDLEPIITEDAIIEIVSPVLKKGHYKWMGIYNGETINFNMQSLEFKNLVQSREVEFKNGTSINCIIRQRRRIDNEGQIKTVAYDVTQVNSYFENDNPVETFEGRKYRQRREADRQQLDLFDTNDNE
ncbi:MAG: hypothetical protein CFE23_16300 [Flavobacterium sp. BFFFF1]|nr:MAG: hypothetical protein CFE23_16300 [Flavobacterium sp. BFFFF1]